MAVNDLAPGFIKVAYNVASRPHIATLPVIWDGVPSVGVQPSVIQNNTLPALASVAVDEYCDAIRVIFHSTATWTGFECWKKEVGGDPVFVYGDDLALAGTSATVPNTDAQATLVFRTSLGNLMKIYLMEHSAADDARIPLKSTAPAPWNTMFSYFTGALGFVVGRDGGRAIAGTFVTTKTNDALRKRRLLFG